ncbi:MAG: RluA family pseudouridine synthase [Clostridia bacterium]|nr:RluA family pseudouridine synthase [Clostridia bacterium]
MIITHIVSPEEDGMSLHALLRGPMSLSARQTRMVKQQGAVTVDAAPFYSNQPVHAGMIVRVQIQAFDGEENTRIMDAVRVEYEDEALLIVFKPALLQCHPSPSAPRGSDTLEERVRQYLGRPAHPVHRLDAETSGLVLFAKAPFAQAHLQKQMQDGLFRKTYLAWVYGIPETQNGLIDAPIDRQTPDSFTRVVREDGQRAVSRYHLLRSVSLGGSDTASLMELSPLTGRTHQLRVHMTHIGHPLLGDARYYTSASNAASASLGLTHHQLCAVSLQCVHPVTGSPLHTTCAPVFSPAAEAL